VTESIPTPSSGADISTEVFLSRSPEVSLLDLRVVETSAVGSGSRLLRIGGEDLAGFAYAPGQDLMFVVSAGDGRIIRRRYTIRRFDPVDLILDLLVVVDIDGPGARWVRALRTGDTVEAIGPRGKITIAEGVSTHVFIGDDVSAPAIAAMVEALPAGANATVIVEVAEPVDEMKVDPAYDINLTWIWLHRDGRAAGEAGSLLDAIAQARVPVEDTHTYVFGEAAVVRVVAQALQDRGLPADRMSRKAYWGRGRANASHGEPLT
jgi:NADPH-dependent ferric siderophore reductase